MSDQSQTHEVKKRRDMTGGDSQTFSEETSRAGAEEDIKKDVKTMGRDPNKMD